MNALKVAFLYKLYSGRVLEQNCMNVLGLNKRQLGLALGGRKKLTEEQICLISNRLGLPVSFFDKKIEIPEKLECLEERIKYHNVFHEKIEIEHVECSFLVCYNTIVKYLLEKYNIPSFNTKLVETVPAGFVISESSNHIYCCDENKELINKFSNNIVEFFGSKNKYIANVFQLLEANGIFVFSFSNGVWYSIFKSQFFMTESNPIVFIEKGTPDKDQRILMIKELAEILIYKKYGCNVILNKSLKEQFAFNVLLQDNIVNMVSNDILNYEKMNKIMHCFNINAKCLLTRLKDIGRIDLSKEKIIEISKQIDNYYQYYYLNTDDCYFEKPKCNDKSVLLIKIIELLNEDKMSLEFLANSVGLSLDDINDFCFNIDSKKENTIKNKNLKLV